MFSEQISQLPLLPRRKWEPVSHYRGFNAVIPRIPRSMTPCSEEIVVSDLIRLLSLFLKCVWFFLLLSSTDSNPVCQIIANVTDIAEGDLILFECEVTYTNNLSPVLISWQQDDSQGVSQAINSTDSVGNGRTVSYIEILAVAPSILPVKALAEFASPLNPPTWAATNTPNYTYEWTTPEITIQCKCSTT